MSSLKIWVSGGNENIPTLIAHIIMCHAKTACPSSSALSGTSGGHVIFVMSRHHSNLTLSVGTTSRVGSGPR
ncbi:hypothetical protein JB92DRAFT_481474 [Gautieria morchelliformis]|nr:hypothetical protein JB92DRAFT_481474 [Gautieria morchelliformis]